MSARRAKNYLVALGGAAILWLAPTAAWGQASSPGFTLQKSTLSSAGDGGLSDLGGTLRMGGSAGQGSVVGRAESASFKLRAGFWSTPGTPVAPGDCDGSGEVSIGEVQKVITMFLGLQAPGCGADCNGDGEVSVGEVQKAINAFLGLAAGC